VKITVRVLPMTERREYPRMPIVSVAAVVFKDNKVLLIKRKYDPGKGKWSVPGGVVELGETLRDAVRREIFEETGIFIEPREVIDAIDVIIRDKDGNVKYHYVIIDFLADYKGGELSPSTDADDARWVDIKELRNYALTSSCEKLFKKLHLLRSE